MISRELLYYPRGLAVDATDGAVAVVEFDTYDRGCDPLSNFGHGSLCAKRDLGRVSRIACAWTADTTKRRVRKMPPWAL